MDPYYDSNGNSFLFFKEIDEYICVVVKLKLRKNKDTYISTVYPINKKKIEKYKELSYIINRWLFICQTIAIVFF